MRIVSPAVQEAIVAGRPLRLEVGAGRARRPGFFSLDVVPLPEVDIVADLEKPLHLLPDGSVAELLCYHVLEHLDNVVAVMEEFHRIVRTDGTLRIRVPHFSNPLGHSDPTHRRTFGLMSMFYFCDEVDQPRWKVPSHYTTCRYEVRRVRIRFFRRGLWDWPIGHVMQWLANVNFWTQSVYERRLAWLWPAEEVEYVLVPKAPVAR